MVCWNFHSSYISRDRMEVRSSLPDTGSIFISLLPAPLPKVMLLGSEPEGCTNKEMYPGMNRS